MSYNFTEKERIVVNIIFLHYVNVKKYLKILYDKR